MLVRFSRGFSDCEKDEKDEMTWWIVHCVVDEPCCIISFEYVCK